VLSSGRARADQPAPARVRMALNSENYGNLALFVAIDGGYFAQQHLDIVIVPFTGSSITQLPLLARGEIDITAVATAPGLFNLPTQGFNVKIVASLSGAHAGWNGTSWLMVRQDLWDAKTIRKPSDLRGMHLDVAAAGAPTDILARETIREAGLTPADLQLTSAVRLPQNWYAALRNHAVDVQAAIEPTATAIEREGLAHKWISYADSVPWIQDVVLAAAPAFAHDQHETLRRFLIGYVQALQDINRSGPTWTPKLAAIVAKYSQLPLATINQIPGPAYAGDLGAVNLASLERVQQFWVNEGLVQTPEPLNSILDLTALNEARKALHIR
jgi:NitT/TauT family transport system substrate-binding protein